MIYRISELPLGLDDAPEVLKALSAARLGISAEEITALRLVKRSVDARKKDRIRFICTVEAECAQNRRLADSKITEAKPFRYEPPRCGTLPSRPVIIGFGPGGLFAALIFAQAGQRPIVFERGAPIEEREETVRLFWETGKLDPNSNVQFGEGGAGTFSDGKLNTGTKDPRARKVLEELAAHGAPSEILYDAKPHIGTDLLPNTVKAIRQEILALGGEVFFHSRVTDLRLREGRVTGVEITPAGGTPRLVEAQSVILAIGHSARDTFRLLHRIGLPMEAKPFSVGARIEHPQRLIDTAQYGRCAGHPALGAADYKLAVHLPTGRGVYTFCMCPGGEVVAAASEPGRMATNGMSRYARDGHNANSALLVGVEPRDFGDGSPLSGLLFQERLEEAAYALGGGGFLAPAQRVEDFLSHRSSTGFGEVAPTCRPGVVPCALEGCLPEFVTEAMREGIRRMDQRLHGFAFPDAVLTAPETRSSSPLRILRDEVLQSPGARGLFPCGEGAGYAGGIVSAAVDGIRCAEQVLSAGAGDIA